MRTHTRCIAPSLSQIKKSVHRLSLLYTNVKKAAGSHKESLPLSYAHLLLIVETVVEDALGFLFTAGQRLHGQRFGEDGEADFGLEEFDYGGL